MNSVKNNVRWPGDPTACHWGIGAAGGGSHWHHPSLGDGNAVIPQVTVLHLDQVCGSHYYHCHCNRVTEVSIWFCKKYPVMLEKPTGLFDNIYSCSICTMWIKNWNMYYQLCWYVLTTFQCFIFSYTFMCSECLCFTKRARVGQEIQTQLEKRVQNCVRQPYLFRPDG